MSILKLAKFFVVNKHDIKGLIDYLTKNKIKYNKILDFNDKKYCIDLINNLQDCKLNVLTETMYRINHKLFDIDMNCSSIVVPHILSEPWCLEYIFKNNFENIYTLFCSYEQFLAYSKRTKLIYIACNININLKQAGVIVALMNQQRCYLYDSVDFTDNFRYHLIRQPDITSKVKFQDIKLYYPEYLCFNSEKHFKTYNKECFYLGVNHLMPRKLLCELAELSGFLNFNGISVWSPETHSRFSRKFRKSIILFLWATRKYNIPKFMIIQFMDYSFREGLNPA